MSRIVFVFLILLICNTTYSQLPDSDGDGVVDSEDVCPLEKGVKENKGCPLQNNNQHNGTIRKSIGVIFDLLPTNKILIVAKGGPADKAGFKSGDVVVKINGTAVQANKEFVNFVRNLDDKEHVFEVKRTNEVKTLKIIKADISTFTQKCLNGDCKNGNGAFVYSNFDYYEGGFKNSKKNGKGIVLLNDGGKYKGGFKNDYYFGEGVLSTPDGSSFTGTFDTVPVNGSGMLNFKNGNRYFGRIENKKLTGEGEYWYNNGNHYAGDFSNGKRNGRGTMIWVSGDKYSGDFSNDKITGQGEYLFKDGRFYSGDFVDGKKQGKGEFTWPSGAKYSGDFSNDHLNGTGDYKEDNGNLYVGKFKDGKKHGDGKYWDKSVPGDWKVIYGTWENDVLVARDGVALNNKNSNNNSGNNNQQNNSSQQKARMMEDATTARIILYEWLKTNDDAREADIRQCQKDRGYGAAVVRMSGHCQRVERYIKELNDKCYAYLKEYEKYTPANHVSDIKTRMREASDGLKTMR